MAPKRCRYGSSGKRRRSWRAFSGRSSPSRTMARASAASTRSGGTLAAIVCISRVVTAS